MNFNMVVILNYDGIESPPRTENITLTFADAAGMRTFWRYLNSCRTLFDTELVPTVDSSSHTLSELDDLVAG